VCTNTAPYGDMDDGCDADEPICVGVGMKEIGSWVHGKNCVKCLNVYNDPPGTVGLRADFGCTDTAPNCINADGSNPKPLWYAGVKCTDACPLNKLDYTSGFDCPSSYSPFKLNGNAKCKDVGTGYLQLTDDLTWQVGSAFVPFTFSNCNSELKFTWEVNYRIRGNTNGIADGLVLVMHQDPRGTSAMGKSGVYLGVYDGPDTAPKGGTIIKSALIIELDTYYNNPAVWPEVKDSFSGTYAIHVMHVDATGAVSEITEVPNADIRSNPGKIKVDYDGTNMKIYINSSASPSVDVPLNLASFFKGKKVNVGFTASTGTLGDSQEVHKFKLLG